ncbi:MAG TPA: hypothetical protein VFO44_12120 [Steroidobacteraceae bacterium]|nr:hypothetical protein [Steroidobacteraceae bacterium]
MSARKPSLFEAILARISLGSTPVDGSYWFDPKPSDGQLRKRNEVPHADWSPVGVGMRLWQRSATSRKNPHERC